MDPQNEYLTPVTKVPSPEVKEVLSLPEATQQKYPFQLFAGLIIATSTVYGLLAWTEPQRAISQTQPAAVAEALPSAFDALTIEAQSAFVVDLSQNKIAYSKNADVQLPLASITKVMLVLAVNEVLSADDIVTITDGAVLRGEGGAPTKGDVWNVKDLTNYTLVASSNVGAEALAEAANDGIRTRYPQAPEEGATVWRMNSLAKELGLTKTYFMNASGLDISATQPSAMGSARDATILLAYAYKTMPEVFAATNQSSLTVGPAEGPIAVVQNTNDASAQIPGLKMGKTGFTDLAGGNLSVVFETSPDHLIVATVLGSSQAGRFTDILTISDASRH